MKTEPKYTEVTPNQLAFDPIDGQFNRGLTKREHFAGLAMQGLLSNPKAADIIMGHSPNDTEITAATIISRTALAYADALIAELNKETP